MSFLEAMWHDRYGNVTYPWMRDEEGATLSGKRDNDWAVRAAARHRLAHSPARGGDELREAGRMAQRGADNVFHELNRDPDWRPTREDYTTLGYLLHNIAGTAGHRKALASTDMAGTGEDLLPAEPRALALSIAAIDAWERSGEALCEIKNEVSFSESVLLCVHELKRLRNLASVPPVEGLTSGEGWQTVRVEPTREMLRAAIEAWIAAPTERQGKERAFWSAMLAASPKATATASVRGALDRVKAAARYVPVGDGYFDPHASHVEAVDAAVDRFAATLADSGTADTHAGREEVGA